MDTYERLKKIIREAGVVFNPKVPLDKKYDRTNIIIPQDGDLEFRVKSLRMITPIVELPSDKSAIYIGSGPSIKNVRHILDIVETDMYVLSDLEFPFENKRVRFADCIVDMTNVNAYDVIKKDKSIGFIMVDQAANNGFTETYNFIPIGTYIYVHTWLPDHPLLNRGYQDKLGLKKLEQDRRLLIKDKDATAQDLEIAKKIYQQ